MHNFMLSTELFFGSKATARLREFDRRNVFVVTDGFLLSSGMLQKMVQYLPRGAHYQTYSDVKPDPSQELVDAGVEAIKRFDPDMVIAFGGGSCIDAAKAILYTAYASGQKKPYFLVIPTTAGTGSEVTNFAVITRGENKVVLIDDSLAPDGALLDASFTMSVPAKITADTGCDVLAHALEAYVSKSATTFTDAMAVKAIRIVLNDLPRVYRDGLAMRSRARMMEASCIAGVAFTNAGLGIVHSLAHALGGRFHVAHGRLNAILLPYVLQFHMSEQKYCAPYDCLAAELGLCDARELMEEIVALRRKLDIEECLADLPQMDRACFEEGLSDIAEAAQHDRCTPTNPRPVSRQDLRTICRDAYRGQRS